jgi:hypothetical protein
MAYGSGVTVQIARERSHSLAYVSFMVGLAGIEPT